MKWIQRIFIIVVCVAVLLPVCFFNFTPNAVSDIDNRMLADNPLEQEGNFTTNVENYVNDRLGFRSDMILAYTVANDRLFGKMVHPSYTYGKDGHVFGAGLAPDVPYESYILDYAKMLGRMQDFCNQRNVPFIYVFEPAKPSVYREFIPEGINYNRKWVDDFLAELDRLNVNYVDNTRTLINKKNEGIKVFNQKYDVNHWNEWGMYYGTKEVLSKLKEQNQNINITQLEDLNEIYYHVDSLLVSKFPIDEYIPYLTVNDTDIENLTEQFVNELKINSNHNFFNYVKNNNLPDAPKAMVFQGSYMNGMGDRFFANAFSEYVSIHDYHNFYNFTYYFNIFKPECIVFESAEYTFLEAYFPHEDMKHIQLEKPFEGLSEEDIQSLSLIEQYEVFEGDTLTTISCVSDSFNLAFLTLDSAYNMVKTENGFDVTVLTENYIKYKENLKIFAL